MNKYLIVEKDREVEVTGFLQRRTYERMLEGLPARELNKQLIEHARE